MSQTLSNVRNTASRNSRQPYFSLRSRWFKWCFCNHSPRTGITWMLVSMRCQFQGSRPDMSSEFLSAMAPILLTLKGKRQTLLYYFNLWVLEWRSCGSCPIVVSFVSWFIFISLQVDDDFLNTRLHGVRKEMPFFFLCLLFSRRLFICGVRNGHCGLITSFPWLW